jgi:hypothetical protein
LLLTYIPEVPGSNLGQVLNTLTQDLCSLNRFSPLPLQHSKNCCLEKAINIPRFLQPSEGISGIKITPEKWMIQFINKSQTFSGLKKTLWTSTVVGIFDFRYFE